MGICYPTMNVSMWRREALCSFYTADQYLVSNSSRGFQSPITTFHFGDTLSCRIDFGKKEGRFWKNREELGTIPFSCEVGKECCFYFRAGSNNEDYTQCIILDQVEDFPFKKNASS